MAKLEGVKVIDMKDGQVERINYNGEDYVRVEDAAQKGDIYVGHRNSMDVTKGAFYKVTSIDNNGYAEFWDDSDDENGVKSRNAKFYRKASLINTIAYEGVEYRKVTDRDAQEGDYIVFTDQERNYITNGKPYELIEIDFCGDPKIIDDDGDAYDTAGDDYEVYEKVTVTSKETVAEDNAELKVGDYAEVIDGSNPYDFEGSLGQVVKIIEKDDSFLPYRCESVTGASLLIGKWAPAYALKKIPVTIHEGQPYREVKREAEVGELIKIVNVEDQRYDNGDISVVNDYFINLPSVNFNGNNCAVYHREYVVLEPLFNEESTQQTEQTPTTESLSFVITTRQGEAHVVAADEHIVTVSEFVEEYLIAKESEDGHQYDLALEHPDLFVPFNNIDSIVVKGAC